MTVSENEYLMWSLTLVMWLSTKVDARYPKMSDADLVRIIERVLRDAHAAAGAAVARMDLNTKGAN